MKSNKKFYLPLVALVALTCSSLLGCASRTKLGVGPGQAVVKTAAHAPATPAVAFGANGFNLDLFFVELGMEWGWEKQCPKVVTFECAAGDSANVLATVPAIPGTNPANAE